MSSTAGNIEAIRDWADRYFYTKSEVNDFFTRLNNGLTAYGLTIYGPSNLEITIEEQSQQDPQTYTIKLNERGMYEDLFFFHAGATIELSSPDLADPISKTLSSYIDTIYVNGLQLATPVMTSNNTPNGICSASTTYGDYQPYKCMNGGNDTDVNNRWLSQNADDGYWQYKFDEPELIAAVEFRGRGQFSGNRDTAHACQFKIQGSNDGITFGDLGTYNMSVSDVDSIVRYTIVNPLLFMYYRIQFIGYNNAGPNGEHFCSVTMMKMYRYLS